MRVQGRHLAFVLASPVLTVSLLAGVVAEQRTHVKPADVEPYHERARAAIAAVPYTIGSGLWTGEDDEVTPAAQKLLRHPAILARTYKENAPDSVHGGHRQASLLIVQCRDSRDMVGHYPPICYRAHGMTAEAFGEISDASRGLKRDWKVGDLTIPGTEYRFTHREMGELHRTVVYNFFIVPGHGIARDMKDVENAAEDYQQRYYGAAQFQVVFSGAVAEEIGRA